MQILAPGSTPEAGFDRPLALLAACHQRIERHCATLERLAEHLQTHGVDASARSAAASLLRYFDQSAQLHHADEEQDLFPLLIAHQPGLAVTLADLRDEHEEQDALWAGLGHLLRHLDALRHPDALAVQARRFARLNQEHLALENAEILPAAGRLLDTDELARLGAAMARRRGQRLASATEGHR